MKNSKNLAAIVVFAFIALLSFTIIHKSPHEKASTWNKEKTDFTRTINVLFNLSVKEIPQFLDAPGIKVMYYKDTIEQYKKNLLYKDVTLTVDSISTDYSYRYNDGYTSKDYLFKFYVDINNNTRKIMTDSIKVRLHYTLLDSINGNEIIIDQQDVYWTEKLTLYGIGKGYRYTSFVVHATYPSDRFDKYHLFYTPSGSLEATCTLVYAKFVDRDKHDKYTRKRFKEINRT